MKTILRALLLSMLYGVSAAHAAPSVAGAWELCVDPDGDPKDVIRLEADGTGQVINADGRTMALNYAVKDTALVLTIQSKGRKLEFPLTVSSDMKKLSRFNEQSKTTSFYVRQGNPDQFACSAK
jgi:hypothetical protein